MGVNPSQWLGRLRSFLDSLAAFRGQLVKEFRAAPPATSVEIEQVQARLGVSLPQSVVRFFTEASAQLEFGFSWTPPPCESAKTLELLTGSSVVSGGYRVGSVGALVEERWDVPWNEEGSIGNRALAKDLKGLAPIVHLGTGSQYCLDFRQPNENPPLVYLSKDCMWEADWELAPIAESFDEFLTHWESVRYLHAVVYRNSTFDHEGWAAKKPTYRERVRLILELSRKEGLTWAGAPT